MTDRSEVIKEIKSMLEAFSGNTYIDELTFYADSFTLRGRTSTGVDDRIAGIAETARETEETGKEILRCAGILEMSFPTIKAISFDTVRNGTYVEGYVRIVFEESLFLCDYSESMRQFLTVLSKMLY